MRCGPRRGVSGLAVDPAGHGSLAAHPTMGVHVRLDERSAAFTALGIGRASGRPALVVTTSGTAAAELHAAVVEADLGGVPLIACTADRPPELRDVGAPQTMDQARLFGGAVRWFCDPGVPDARVRPTGRSLAARSVAEATSGTGGPGPVHLNLPFREPLVGDPAGGRGSEPGPARRAAVAPGGPRPRAALGRDGRGAGRVRPAGPRTPWTDRGRSRLRRPEAVLALADSLGWPVLADPRSGARRLRPGVVGAADAILRSQTFAPHHRPDIVLGLGEAWVSKVVNAFLSPHRSRPVPRPLPSTPGGVGAIPGGRRRCSCGPIPRSSVWPWPAPWPVRRGRGRPVVGPRVAAAGGGADGRRPSRRPGR